jgi:hypothetical protein
MNGRRFHVGIGCILAIIRSSIECDAGDIRIFLQHLLE